MITLSISSNHFVLTLIFMIDMVKPGHVILSCKKPIRVQSFGAILAIPIPV